MASSLLPRLLLRRARAGAGAGAGAGARAPPFPIPSVPLLTLPPHSLPQIRESQIPIFPTFPLFSHLDPIWDPRPLPDPDTVLRADSVKKKRKRKMNKHKLRKLRKQLRLRT